MLAAMALLLAAVTAWSSQAIAPVATPVYSAAILVHSAAWSGGDGESSANRAAVRALVELYSQQSQSVALIEAADLIAATLSSAVLSHTKVLHVPDGLGLTAAQSAQTEEALLAWVRQQGGSLALGGGALLGGQLSAIAAVLGVNVTQVAPGSPRRCGGPITLSRSSVLHAQNWKPGGNFTTTDSGLVIHDLDGGSSAETIATAQCSSDGSGRKNRYAVARGLGTQRGWLAYVAASAENAPILQVTKRSSKAIYI